MRSYIIIGILAIIVICALVFLFHTGNGTPSVSNTQNSATSSSPSISETSGSQSSQSNGAGSGTSGKAVVATINQKSLATASANPTFTGFASGVSTVYVGITSAQTGGGPSYGPVAVPVINGAWSLVVSSSTLKGNPWVSGGLPAGKYVAQIWSSSAQGHANEIDIGNTTFTVGGSTAPIPYAWINQVTLTNPGVKLAGGSAHAASLTVVLVPVTYNGTNDWASVMSAALAFQKTQTTVDDATQDWTASFATSPSDFYPYVYDTDTHQLLDFGIKGNGEVVVH